MGSGGPWQCALSLGFCDAAGAGDDCPAAPPPRRAVIANAFSPYTRRVARGELCGRRRRGHSLPLLMWFGGGARAPAAWTLQHCGPLSSERRGRLRSGYQICCKATLPAAACQSPNPTPLFRLLGCCPPLPVGESPFSAAAISAGHVPQLNLGQHRSTTARCRPCRCWLSLRSSEVPVWHNFSEHQAPNRFSWQIAGRLADCQREDCPRERMRDPPSTVTGVADMRPHYMSVVRVRRYSD